MSKNTGVDRDVSDASGHVSSAVRLLTDLFSVVRLVRRRKRPKNVLAQNTTVEDGPAVSSASSALSLARLIR